MPGISTVTHSAGGLLIATQGFVLVEGFQVVRVNDPVTPHGNGAHQAPTMQQGSSLVTVDGVPVVIAGKAASCGHLATGSDLVDIAE